LANKSNIEQLLFKCKEQEWAAQKELYLLFADEMMSIAIRYSNDLTSAKDLVQETFLTFFQKIEQYDASRGALGAWLRRILINTSFAQYRKDKRIVFYGDDNIVDKISEDASAVEALEAEDILNLLKELPRGCRHVFNLKVIEGYSHGEIGDLLEITPSASRSQLTRAKRLLRDMINERELSENYLQKGYRSNQI